MTLKSEFKLIWILIVKIEEDILGNPTGTLIIT